MATLTSDFKGVIEKGDYEGGDYLFEIKNATLEAGKNGPYIELTLQFMEGKYAGLYNSDIVSFSQKSLWRAKQFLKAVGYDVPDDKFTIETNDLLGLQFRCHAEREVDEKGKFPPKLRITQFWNKEHIQSALAPETPAQTSSPGAPPPSAPASAPAPAPAAPAAAPAAAPSEPPARPKLKV